ncbi:hypothetical protein H9K76_21825 [Diaphorobacter ruginosibacter]|uniref:Uncharacterized protein n=1 Tax=Diaphorobacter ruginosibacter TaxID=1715720 RepID=A0A7G9RNB1_9BURK|nr:hypothetical protein [Diaphorobacter ruginosibacter]QNN57086.1 hypothetical protein H9K76_21825 [Diaphorobacter ruginosibacter]
MSSKELSSEDTLAKRILFIMINEQGLRAGDGMSPDNLVRDLTRHGIGQPELQQAVQHAKDRGWLRDGPYGELQLTETGFAVD